jgi:hypothetical protein
MSANAQGEAEVGAHAWPCAPLLAVTPIKRTSCEMRPEARLRLYPPKLKQAHRQVVIRFEDGKTFCGTGKDADDREVKYDAQGAGPAADEGPAVRRGG